MFCSRNKTCLLQHYLIWMNKMPHLLTSKSSICTLHGMSLKKDKKLCQRSRLDDDDEFIFSNNITNFLYNTCCKIVINWKSFIFLLFHNLLLLYCKFSIPEELYYISTYTLCQVHHFPGFSEVSFTLLQRLRKSSKQQPVVLRTYVYTMYRFF